MATHPHLLELRAGAGRALRALRAARDLSPAALGAQLGRAAGSAGRRIGDLESGRRTPTREERAALRAIFGELPAGWDRADALEAEMTRHAEIAEEREGALLAALLPGLIQRVAEVVARTGWRDVPIGWPRSGSTITGNLRVTLGGIVHGATERLRATHDGRAAIVVAAGGSLLSGAGGSTVLLLGSDRYVTRDGDFRAAFGALLQSHRDLYGAERPGPTRWDLSAVAAELGLSVEPVALRAPGGALLARWSPQDRTLRAPNGAVLDTAPHPDDAEAWAAREADMAERPAAERRLVREGRVEDGAERVVALLNGWVPAALAYPSSHA